MCFSLSQLIPVFSVAIAVAAAVLLLEGLARKVIKVRQRELISRTG